jgi:hypothetical protein
MVQSSDVKMSTGVPEPLQQQTPVASIRQHINASSHRVNIVPLLAQTTKKRNSKLQHCSLSHTVNER